ITPSHLDGHMHAHVVPGISEVVVKLAREFHIPAVRCTAEPAGRALRVAGGAQRFTALAVSTLARRQRGLLDRAGVAHPARLYRIVETSRLDERRLAGLLRSLPADGAVSELLCHPGYGEPELARVGGMLQAPERETEVRALTSPEIGALVDSQGIRLVSY